MLIVPKQLFVWGSGANGRLGLPSDDTCCLPEMLPLAGDASVESVFCGRDCTIVVTTDHTLFGCGSNRYNKLGLLDHSTQNQQAGSFVSSQEAHELVMISLPPLAGQHVINVAMGTNHTLLLTETGQLYSLGSNQYGQLGRPAEAGTEAAGLVQGFEGKFVSKVACGDFFSVAVTRDNEVYSWGRAERCRLGTSKGTVSVQGICTNIRPFAVSLVFCLNLVCHSGHSRASACHTAATVGF
eukprot:m.290868 g.290868  ORF g.290868 m.290868 type:complete len:240 (+) comp19472_c0_seq5:69-788(+)